jgi:hypothetical protein
MFNTDDLDEDALKNMEIMKKLGILSEDGEVIKHTFSITWTATQKQVDYEIDYPDIDENVSTNKAENDLIDSITVTTLIEILGKILAEKVDINDPAARFGVMMKVFKSLSSSFAASMDGRSSKRKTFPKGDNSTILDAEGEEYTAEDGLDASIVEMLKNLKIDPGQSSI